jgi:hypothetical protein
MVSGLVWSLACSMIAATAIWLFTTVMRAGDGIHDTLLTGQVVTPPPPLG